MSLPERKPTDGPINIIRTQEDDLIVSVTTDGEIQSIAMSEYNAARILASLCIFLDVPIPKKLLKLPMG